MFDHDADDLFDSSEALDAIAELERNTSSAILSQRSSERLEIKTKVLVRPANASQRHEFNLECVTADISNGGCMVLAGRPVIPGDLYWLTFDDAQIKVGSLYARCLRCRYVREEIYEAGFRFLNDISLRDALDCPTESLL